MPELDENVTTELVENKIHSEVCLGYVLHHRGYRGWVNFNLVSRLFGCWVENVEEISKGVRCSSFGLWEESEMHVLVDQFRKNVDEKLASTEA